MREPSLVIPVTASIDDDAWCTPTVTTCPWCGGITDRRCCAPRWNASAGGPTGSRAGTSWRFPPSPSWEVRVAYSAWQRWTNGEIAASPALPIPNTYFPRTRSDESPALADSRPVLIGETRAHSELARLMVDRNFVLRWALRRRDDVGFRVTERELPTYPPGTIPRSAGRSGRLGGGSRAGPVLGQPAGSNTQVELAVHRLECSRRCGGGQLARDGATRRVWGTYGVRRQWAASLSGSYRSRRPSRPRGMAAPGWWNNAAPRHQQVRAQRCVCVV